MVHMTYSFISSYPPASGWSDEVRWLLPLFYVLGAVSVGWCRRRMRQGKGGYIHRGFSKNYLAGPLGCLIFSLMALLRDPIYQIFSKGFRGQPSYGPPL